MTYQIEDDMFALYGEWLGVALTDCEAWSTANQAFQRNYCAAHDGRTAEQHHAHMAQMFADFFEAAIDANVQALPAPAAPAAPAAAAPPLMCVIAEMPSAVSHGSTPAVRALALALPTAQAAGAPAALDEAALAEALEMYGKWLTMARADYEAMSTADASIMQRYRMSHHGRTHVEHHEHLADLYAAFFEAALGDTLLDASAAPTTTAAPAASAAQAASGHIRPHQAISGHIRPHQAASGKQHQQHQPHQQRQLQQPRQPRPQHQPHRAASGRTPAAAAPAEPISGEPLLQGISPTAITAIEAMPSAASDSMVAAVSSTHQQISASRSAFSSAALSTGLSSARHDGEPISQGISPTTIAAITAVPSAASDGVVAAVSSTHQRLSASRSASSSAALCTGLSSARHDGEPISQGISPTTIAAITAVPSAASDGVVAAVSSTHQRLNARCITFRLQGQPSNTCQSHECHCHLPESVLLRA